MPGFSGRTVLGFQALTVSTASVALTASAGARAAYITVEANPIRFRLDGSAPTSSAGHLMVPTAGTPPLPFVLELESEAAVANFRAIRQGGADATLHVTYYG